MPNLGSATVQWVSNLGSAMTDLADPLTTGLQYLASKVVDGRVPENQALHGDTSPSKHTDITAVVYV